MRLRSIFLYNQVSFVYGLIFQCASVISDWRWCLVGREAFFLFFSSGSHDKPQGQMLCLWVQVGSADVALGFTPCLPLRVFSIWLTNLSWSSLDWERGLMKSEIAQLCPTLCDPMDCSPPGSSMHGIFQARVLEWVAISFSRGSSWPKDRTRVSHIAGRCFTA